MQPLASVLAESFPDAESLIPDGPHLAGAGRRWWDVEGNDLDGRAQRIEAASVQVEQWLAAELEQRDLRFGDLVVFGFSQGAALAAELGARRTLGGVVSFCGRPVAPSGTEGQTPILLIHGAHDRLIPSTQAATFAAKLQERGAPVSFLLLPGVGHEIDSSGVGAARDFLAALTQETLPRADADEREQ